MLFIDFFVGILAGTTLGVFATKYISNFRLKPLLILAILLLVYVVSEIAVILFFTKIMN